VQLIKIKNKSTLKKVIENHKKNEIRNLNTNKNKQLIIELKCAEILIKNH